MRRSPGGAPSPARAEAWRILLRVEREGAWASALLAHREGHLGDSREAGLLHEIVLGVLRHRASLDHALGSVSSRPPAEMDAEVRAALRIGAYALLRLDRVPDFAAVSSAVDLLGGASRRAFVNAVLRQVARRGRTLLPARPERGDAEGLARYESFPRFWIERHVARAGWDATAALAAACNRPAPTVVRPAVGRAGGREELLRRLAEQGIEAEPCRFVPEALRLRSGSPARVVAEGLAWVQDEAAQLVPRLLGRELGPRVADLCAAPGGKTLQIAQALPTGGIVVALERHPGRTRRLAANVARFAAGRAVVVRADAARAVPLRAVFREVLVDAPCSGTGTLRRHPEIKWRLAEEDPKLLAVRQTRLLESAAALTESGGSIVYAVCSLEPEEGEDVVRGFLASRPDYRLADPRPLLPEAAWTFVREPGWLVTTPVAGDLDGFFAARLERRDE